VTSTWVGSNDSSGLWWPDSGLADEPHDMIRISSDHYDDTPTDTAAGQLAQVILYTGNSADPDHVTNYYYDWRHRLVATDSAAAATGGGDYPIAYNVLDNLGETTESDIFDGSNITVTMGNDGVPEKPDSSALRAETTYTYNAAGQVLTAATHSINQSTGADEGALVSTNYYDAAGNLIAASAPGGLWTKYTYDGAGRVTGTYLTDGAGGTDNVNNVDSDHVLSEQILQYDGDGNVTWNKTYQRYDTVVLSGAGPLGALNSDDARISYVLNWYDHAGRLTESVNYGTDGGDVPSPSRRPVPRHE